MSLTAKLFMHGRSQAVRLPDEFRFEGDEVRVSKVGDKVILEPLKKRPIDLDAWFLRLDELGARDFLPDGIPDEPPAEPDPRVFLDEWSVATAPFWLFEILALPNTSPRNWFLAQTFPDGQIISDYQKSCQAPFAKIFRFRVRWNQPHNARIPSRQ